MINLWRNANKLFLPVNPSSPALKPIAVGASGVAGPTPPPLPHREPPLCEPNYGGPCRCFTLLLKSISKRQKLTFSSRQHDPLGDGVLVIFLHHRVPVVVPHHVVLVEELLQRRRLGQELLHHLPADVRGFFHPQFAQDLGFDGVESHGLRLLPHLAGGALAQVLRAGGGQLRVRFLVTQNYWTQCDDECETERDRRRLHCPLRCGL